MTIINRKDLSIYNHYMLDGIHEAMEAVGLPVSAMQSVGMNVLKKDEKCYDLQGRLTSSLSRGIYIQNGKKFSVR